MLSLKKTLQEALQERNVDEDWKSKLKKGLGAAAMAGGLAASPMSQKQAIAAPPSATTQASVQPSKAKPEANRADILAAIKAVESSGRN